MSDYNFLKSGSGNNINLSNKQIQELQSLVLLFTENALKSASLYVQHANRNIVQLKDIQNCMKLEAIIFCDKSNIIQDANTLFNEIYNNEQNEDDDDVSDIFTDDTEEYTLSKCQCNLCNIINDIDSFWNNWSPKSPLEHSLKNNLDKFQI